MFDIHCSECGKHQLLPISRIRRLINHDQGIEVIFECWCGAPGTYRTGKNAETGGSRTTDSQTERHHLRRLPSHAARW